MIIFHGQCILEQTHNQDLTLSACVLLSMIFNMIIPYFEVQRLSIMAAVITVIDHSDKLQNITNAQNGCS